MPSTYEKITTVTVGAGGASSIAFTSIPQIYTDLVVKVSARRSDSSEGSLSTRFNSDSGSNYSNRTIRGSGTAASSSIESANNLLPFWVIDGTGYTANTFASANIYIPNYTSANQKSVSAENVAENNNATSYMQMTSGLWSGTAAITAITLYANEQATGTFAQYSTATLYGVTKYAETGVGSKAIGGTVTTAGGYTYHTFRSSGMFTPTSNITGAEVLCVAGGGGAGGAAWAAGGGGAGGLVYASGQSLTASTGYTAIVGAGGTSGRGTQSGDNGSNSSFGSLTVALGGGGGGGYQGGGQNPYAARVGGSGGGGPAGQGYGGSDVGAAGTAGQGNAGGNSIYNPHMSGGGGGGAGAAGVNGTTTKAGNGGAGLSTYSAWGAATGTGENIGGTYWYAGGGGGSGGGAFNGWATGSVGGNGGGGQGAHQYDFYGTKGLPTTGGGGGPNDQGDIVVGSGGSGIVIVRYTT